MTPNEVLVPIQERTLSGSVWKVILCPQMDLVAVVLDRNSVTIYRTNWQRLATISVCSAREEVITSVAWSPDGANLVVGTSSKLLAVYSVDRCASTAPLRAKRNSRETEPILTRQLPAVPTAILWSTTPSMEATTKRFPEYESRAEKIHESKSSGNSESCNGLLLLGDADGMMTILTHNLLLSVARIPTAPDGFVVKHIQLTASQRYCLTSGSNAGLCTEDSQKLAGATQLVLRAFDLNPVLEYWPELDRLGYEVMKFTSVIQKLSVAVEKVQEGWVEGACEVLNSTVEKPLEKLITKFAEEDKSAWQALHDVYCGARIKGAILQFLANDLSENGAKEALRSFRNHVDDTEELVFSMIPTVENTVFSSSEYRGLARLESRFKPIGVELSQAEKLFGVSEKLLWAVGDLVGELEEEAQEAEAFLAWLVTAAGKAGGESARPRGPNIADKISSKDAVMISKFLSGRSSSKPSEVEFAKKSVSHLLINEVKPALEQFKKAVETVIRKPCDAISAQLRPNDEISFPDYEECCSPTTLSTMNLMSEHDDNHDVDLIPSVGKNSFVRIRFNFVRAKWMVRRYSLAKLGLQVETAAMLTANTVLLVTTESRPAAGEERSGCNVSLYEVDSKDLDPDIMMDGSETNNTSETLLPDAVEFSGRKLDSKPCGNFAARGDVALSVNALLGLVCVLVAPRKIFVFKYQTLKEHRNV